MAFPEHPEDTDNVENNICVDSTTFRHYLLTQFHVELHQMVLPETRVPDSKSELYSFGVEDQRLIQRLQTFQNWPYGAFFSSVELARAGCIYQDSRSDMFGFGVEDPGLIQRLQSFQDWPYEAFFSSVELARASCIYQGNGVIN